MRFHLAECAARNGEKGSQDERRMWIFGFPDLLKFYSALRELETVWKNSTDMKLYDICVVQVCKNMWFNVKLKFERSRNDKFLWIRLFDFTVFNFNLLYFVFKFVCDKYKLKGNILKLSSSCQFNLLSVSITTQRYQFNSPFAATKTVN